MAHEARQIEGYMAKKAADLSRFQVNVEKPPESEAETLPRKRGQGAPAAPLITKGFDTVVKILCHVYPLRAWCNARVVCSRPSARDSRSMSRAMRPSKQTWLRTRYTLFCIFRWRRLPRSTALEVAGNNVSSRNVRAFSRCGEKTFF